MIADLYNGDGVQIWHDGETLTIRIGMCSVDLDKNMLKELDKGLAVALLQMQKDGVILKSWEELSHSCPECDEELK